ncbi:hypothetical protein RIF24_16975 (plasmid) [Exiguobacterium acetylicum]|uniref:hypothetical protein n=1 Tax=Exiguobacterium TaxID=33986 RepID=UPI001BEAE303|nr:hypothetical protein [Exiguobacterium sp. s191]
MSLSEDTRLKTDTTSEITWLDEVQLTTPPTRKEKHVRIPPSVASLLPIVDATALDGFEMQDGTFCDIIQLTSKDIYGLSETEKDHDIFSLAYLLQAYIHPLKVIPLNTPLNLEKQKQRIERQLRQNQNTAYRPFLQKKKQELIYLEEHRTNRDYLLFFYAPDEAMLRERRHQLTKLLRRSNPMVELTLEQKMHVLFQLHNSNTKPTQDGKE